MTKWGASRSVEGTEWSSNNEKAETETSRGVWLGAAGADEAVSKAAHDDGPDALEMAVAAARSLTCGKIEITLGPRLMSAEARYI